MDFLLLYHFRNLKGVAIEIFLTFVDDITITPNMIFEILAIKFLSEIEKYLAMATLIIFIIILDSSKLISHKIRDFPEILFFKAICNKVLHSAQCGKYGDPLSCIFCKNIVKLTVLLNKLLKSWFDEKSYWWDEKEFLVFPHCGSAHSVIKWKIYSQQKNISSNQLFGNFFSNKRYFHEILSWVKITLCAHSQCGSCRNSLSHFFRINFVKVIVLQKKLLKSWFDEEKFEWERISRFSTLWVWKLRIFTLTLF